MKTKLTKQLESTLYQYCLEQGAYVVEEVAMPADKGIVDTLSYQQLPDGQIEWRCYELKVTKGQTFIYRSLQLLCLAATTLPRSSIGNSRPYWCIDLPCF